LIKTKSLIKQSKFTKKNFLNFVTFFRNKHEKIMKNLKLNLPFLSFSLEDLLASDNNGRVLWKFADILLYFLEFNVFCENNLLNFINKMLLKTRDLILNAISLIQNEKHNKIWICLNQIFRFVIDYIKNACSALDK
jgi:hypothetical protein